MAKKENTDLPRAIPELKGALSQNEHEIAGHIKTYNSLPEGHKDRRGIYAKIQELHSYSDWD